MIRSFAAIALLAALAGCSGEPGNDSADNSLTAAAKLTPENTTDGTGRDYIGEVARLPVGQRNGVFIRALRDGNLDCQGVAQSAPAPDVGVGAWRVQCVDGRKHLIQVLNNGTVDIVSGPPTR